MTHLIANATRAQLIQAGAHTVDRAGDNSGTYVLNAEGNAIAFIGNSESRDGVWLYYSADVREWLGL